MIVNEGMIAIGHSIRKEDKTVIEVTTGTEYKKENGLQTEIEFRKRKSSRIKKRSRIKYKMQHLLKLMMLIGKFRRNLEERGIRMTLGHHISRDG